MPDQNRVSDLRLKCIAQMPMEARREDILSMVAELQALRAGGSRLWLWRNGDHFLAFPSLFPTMPGGGDPATLGEPAAWAILKPSRPDPRDNDPAQIERAERFIQSLRSGWRGMETAPRDGTRILGCWHLFDNHREIVRFEGDCWIGGESGYLMVKNEPTVWQPLPSPPKDGEG